MDGWDHDGVGDSLYSFGVNRKRSVHPPLRKRISHFRVVPWRSADDGTYVEQRKGGSWPLFAGPANGFNMWPVILDTRWQRKNLNLKKSWENYLPIFGKKMHQPVTIIDSIFKSCPA